MHTQVAWIHIDRQMILTIHRHVISRIPRYSVTYDNANTWQLHVNQAQQDDRGYYMCQVSVQQAGISAKLPLAACPSSHSASHTYRITSPVTITQPDANKS